MRTQDTTLPPLEQERKAFEAWCIATQCAESDLERGRLSGYRMQELNRMWVGWQARASLVDAKKELQQIIAENAGRAAFLDSHPAVTKELCDLIEDNERLRAAIAAQAQRAVCQECKGSGEGGSYHVPGTESNFVEGPCRACNGSGEATPQQAQQAQGVPTPDLARALMLADVLACGERGDATMIEAGNILRSLALAKQAQGVPAAALKRIKQNLMHQRQFGTETLGAWRMAATQAEGDIEELLAAAPQAEPVQPQQAEEALAQALRNIATTLERQLDLIAERAPGEFLDKRPVVQSLAQHLKRARKALADYSSGHAQAEPQPEREPLSDSAMLDFMAERRVALVPEFEGDWEASVYLEEGEAQESYCGATPRAALASAMHSAGIGTKGGDKP